MLFAVCVLVFIGGKRPASVDCKLWAHWFDTDLTNVDGWVQVCASSSRDDVEYRATLW